MNNKENLSSFIQKAAQRLEAKKVVKHQELYVPSIDEKIKIRNLTKDEITECFEMEDSIKSDNYSIYLAVVEPDLREVAKELKSRGQITEFVDVVDIFNMQDRTSIVKEVMKLSEVISDKRVEVIEHLKN
ncbi:MAG: hypothetical protein Q4A72_05500 [Bacillota bacterium]|nr:hypothetical protein [Bacillota bacterium]